MVRTSKTRIVHSSLDTNFGAFVRWHTDTRSLMCSDINGIDELGTDDVKMTICPEKTRIHPYNVLYR